MAEIDKVKEEIGWLKVAFGLLVAVDVSLIAWTAQNFAKASGVMLALSSLVVIAVTWAIIRINRSAFSKIEQLREL